MLKGWKAMNDGCCPYAGVCPHIARIEQEVHEMEDETKGTLKELWQEMNMMRKTLYVIAGILMCELGVTVL